MKANTGLKPALKKKSLSDVLRSPSSTALFKSPSDISLKDEDMAASKDVIKAHRQARLRFNDFVEQCVAVSDEDDVEEESSDDDAIIMNICPKRTTSIVKIEPTRLKLSESSRDRSNRRRSSKGSKNSSKRASSTTNSRDSQSKVSYRNYDDDEVDVLDLNSGSEYDDDFFDSSAASSAPSTPPDTPINENTVKTSDHHLSGGLTGTAINIVSDMVHWASSFVFNNGVF